MKTLIQSHIQAIREIVSQLQEDGAMPLDEEQTEDLHHILNALDLLEKRLTLLDTLLEPDIDLMMILHDLTSPISGIIGYLFILKQEYTSSLTKQQYEKIVSIETQTNEMYQLINSKLLRLHNNIQ